MRYRASSKALRVGAAMALICVAAGAAPTVAKAAFCGMVANADDNSVSFFDTATNAVTKTIAVGVRPGTVAIRPDGRLAYVSNTNDGDTMHQPGMSDTLSVIDTPSGEVVTTVTVGRRPVGLAVTPDGNSLYSANEGSGTVSVVDTGSNAVVNTIHTGGSPAILSFNPDGSRCYVSDNARNSVLVIDTAAAGVVGTIPVGMRPQGIAFSADGHSAYVANSMSASISVIDSATMTVSRTINLDASPFLVTPSLGGQLLYVTHPEANHVSVLDTSSGEVSRSILVGDFPQFAALRSDGGVLYVANTNSHSISVVNTDTNSVSMAIPVGRTPRGVALVAVPSGCPQTRLPPYWLNVAPLPEPRQAVGVGTVDGRVYVVGGAGFAAETLDTVQYYDPAQNRWLDAAPLPGPLQDVAIAVVGERLYAIGGLYSEERLAFDSLYELDTQNDHWEQRAPLPRPRGAAGAAVIDGRIYVAGGYRDGAVDDFAVYDPATGRWTSLPPLPTARAYLGVAAIDGIAYAVGGVDAEGALSGVLEAYDPVQGMWRRDLPPMPTARGRLAAVSLGDRLFTFGGEGNDASPEGVFGTTERFDTHTVAWKTLPDMPTPRHGAGAAVRGTRLLVVGGAFKAGYGPTAAIDVLVTAEPGQPLCQGDCDGDAEVSADEIAQGTHLIFDARATASCPRSAFDHDADGRATAADVIAAVLNFDERCSSSGPPALRPAP